MHVSYPRVSPSFLPPPPLAISPPMGRNHHIMTAPPPSGGGDRPDKRGEIARGGDSKGFAPVHDQISLWLCMLVPAQSS